MSGIFYINVSSMGVKFEKYLLWWRQQWLGEKGKEEEEPDAAGLLEVYRELDRERPLREKLEEYARYPADRKFREFSRQVKRRTVGRRWIGWSAAAVVVGGMLSAVLWFRPEDPQQIRMSPLKTETITPGTRKAVLKLADGNVVHVGGDSMQIREQEGTTIGYAYGKLSYRSAEKMTELVYNELTVPLSGECFLTLDDGTRVWLNSDSWLKYPVKFTEKDRTVFLKGEAYFEVVKNSKPFTVVTSLGKVNVMGTSFGVKAYEEEHAVYTTLVTGKVNFAGPQTLEIAPGEQVVAYAGGKMEKRRIDPDEYIGWKKGLYVFKNRSLEDIMTELSRWYGMTVFYQNPGVKEVRFTGNLKRYDNIGAFMEALERTGEVRYKMSGNTIMLFQ